MSGVDPGTEAADPGASAAASGGGVQVGDELPCREIESVSAEKMKTMAALWATPTRSTGTSTTFAAWALGDRPVNQGPNNMGYVIDMLTAWAGGPESFRRLKVRFSGNVFAGDRLVAGGTVTAVQEAPEGHLVDCEVWLARIGKEPVLTGTATVLITAREW